MTDQVPQEGRFTKLPMRGMVGTGPRRYVLVDCTCKHAGWEHTSAGLNGSGCLVSGCFCSGRMTDDGPAAADEVPD